MNCDWIAHFRWTEAPHTMDMVRAVEAAAAEYGVAPAQMATYLREEAEKRGGADVIETTRKIEVIVSMRQTHKDKP